MRRDLQDQQQEIGGPQLRPVHFEPGYRLTFLLDPDGTVRDITEAYGVVGLDADAFKGMTMQAIASGATDGAGRAAEWVARLARAAEQPGPARYIDERPDPVSGESVIELVLTPVHGAGGELQTVVAQARDVVPERRHRQLEEQLSTAIAISRLGRYTLHFREARLECDARFSEIAGVPDAADVLAEQGMAGFFSTIHADDVVHVQRAYERSLAGEHDYGMEYRLWRPTPHGPELRWVAVLGRVEFDAEGPVQMVGVARDITDQRREGDARMHQQKREALGTLAGGIAHDFNNVISAILSNASVAEHELEVGDSPATSLEEIGRGARRARDLVKRMVAFSREEEPTRELFDLAAVTAEACSLLRPTLPSGVELTVRAEHPLPRMLGDSGQLHQVIMNLVTNAAQAIGDGPGQIRVFVDEFEGPEYGPAGMVPPGDYLRIRVCDDGPGLPEDAIGRIFDPFFTTKPLGQGTGLGLAVTQTIVHNHDGFLTAESGPASGTVFGVYIPAAHLVTVSLVAPPGAPPPPSAPAAADDDPNTGHARVLFVDDEEALARLAERAMPNGCSAVALSDPTIALERFVSDPNAFDVLVTDLSMPGLTGLELINRVRAIRPELPVVLSSGYLTDESRRAAERLRIDAVVSKPCSIDDLAAAAVGVVDARRAAAKAARVSVQP
jgi:signal transduction histidine kinase/ActR/RegA family two-component response regulator